MINTVCKTTPRNKWPHMISESIGSDRTPHGGNRVSVTNFVADFGTAIVESKQTIMQGELDSPVKASDEES